MRTIPLGGRLAAGRVAVVDDEDYPLLARYSWFAVQSKPGAPLYAATNVQDNSRRSGQRIVRMHVMIMGRKGIDHRNRNGLDNQRENLRPATKVENARNLPVMRPGRSRYKGVGFHSLNGRWRARIRADNGSVSLGVYATEEEAARAYDAAARKYHGEFAYLNFPDEQAS